MNRSIALGPSVYFIVEENPTEEALKHLNFGLRYDPNAVDLLQAKLKYTIMLGKHSEAVATYRKLAILAPKADIITKFKISE